MALTTEKNKVIYDCNGSTQFYFDFPILEKTDLQVWHYDENNNKKLLRLDTDYVITLNDDNTGYVVLNLPCNNGKLLLYREVPYTQETVYPENSPFPAKSHEEALDKLTMETQQLKEKIERTAIADPITHNIDLNGQKITNLGNPEFSGDAVNYETLLNAVGKPITHTVNTVKDLLSVKPDNNSAVLVKGYHQKGDSGGGIFYWDPDEPKGHHNGGTVINPDLPFPDNWDDLTQRKKWFMFNWQALTDYNPGDIIKPTIEQDYYLICITAGTSGTHEPTWDTVDGNFTVDGSTVWRTVNKKGCWKRIYNGNVFTTWFGNEKQYLKKLSVSQLPRLIEIGRDDKRTKSYKRLILNTLFLYQDDVKKFNIQGLCYFDGYFYVGVDVGGGNGRIIRVLPDGSLDTSFGNVDLPIGHAAEICYKDGYFYVANGSAVVGLIISKVSSNGRTVIEQIDKSYLGNSGLIAYDMKYDVFILHTATNDTSPHKITICNSDFTDLYSFEIPNQGVPQGIEAHNGVIYLYTNNKITAINYNGDIISDYTFLNKYESEGLTIYQGYSKATLAVGTKNGVFEVSTLKEFPFIIHSIPIVQKEQKNVILRPFLTGFSVKIKNGDVSIFNYAAHNEPYNVLWGKPYLEDDYTIVIPEKEKIFNAVSSVIGVSRDTFYEARVDYVDGVGVKIKIIPNGITKTLTYYSGWEKPFGNDHTDPKVVIKGRLCSIFGYAKPSSDVASGGIIATLPSIATPSKKSPIPLGIEGTSTILAGRVDYEKKLKFYGGHVSAGKIVYFNGIYDRGRVDMKISDVDFCRIFIKIFGGSRIDDRWNR